MISTTARWVRYRVPLFALFLAVFTAGLVTVSANPALADTSLCSGNSYGSCTDAGYTDHAYGANNGTSYWSMTSGHNCTNYVAWVESQVYGVPTPSYNLGNADAWATNAQNHSVTVNTTPAVGSVAQWGDSTNHPTGHVAIVEAVNNDGSITVSEDNFSSGPFKWETITTSSSNWPNNFIHFKDPANLLLARVSNTLYGKQGLTDGWGTVATDATDVQASGQRIAYEDTSGNLKAKDGLNSSTWYTEVSAGTTVNQYIVTPNLLLVREGNTILGKQGLNDSWSTVATDAADVQAAGTRIAYLDTSGNLHAKDGLTSPSWYTEVSGTTVDQYVLTPSLLLVREGNTLYGKGTLNVGWSTVATDATDVQAAGTRIAYTDTSGNLKAKDGLLSVSWVTETNSFSQYAVTADNYLLIRQTNSVYGKAALTDGWSNPALTTSAVGMKATYARFAFLTSSNELYAKDTLGGTMYDEQSNVSQYVVS